MFTLGLFSIDEIRTIHGRPATAPGDPVPLHVRQRIAWHELRAADSAGSKLARVTRPRLVQKLRLVFARG